MLRYLRENLWRGLKTSPFKGPARAWALFPAFAAAALVVGFAARLFSYAPLPLPAAALLAVTLVVFPSIVEEAFFRGVLIPRDTAERGRGRAAANIAVSTLLFVAWHPLNALVFTPSAAPIFLDPWFLVIVAALGVTCGYAYVVSKSIWAPVIIHWATVFAWVLFLGGRNLVLEM
ncbi:MAG: CPBP family glutamic-type intramembrane protease [Candidatus Erginobacter occultus]|nr:CPBP family glutamic-type intramembrane protease [Candidatus Erginobacter occultus]